MKCMDSRTAQPADITQWLAQLDAGGPGGAGAQGAQDTQGAQGAQAVQGAEASSRLFAELYDELKRNARAQMRKEYAGHTLSATALTHEAWFRLTAQSRTQWQSRGHFLGVAAIMMRRILVNHAVAKQALKRDALLVPLTLAEAEQVAGGPSADVVRVHEALLAFEPVDPRAAKVVELKFFGGLENEEIAEVLGLSLATVKRDWALARAWLHRELQGA